MNLEKTSLEKTSLEKTNLENIQQAIEDITKCKEIHQKWVEYQQANPDWAETTPAARLGNPEHHVDWVRRYENVLAVLRDAEAKEKKHETKTFETKMFETPTFETNPIMIRSYDGTPVVIEGKL